MDAKKYRPSAYVFSPTTESRVKLYKGMLSRAASDYKFEPVHGGDYYQAVYSPPVIKELLQGAAINAPLAGLGATALGYLR